MLIILLLATSAQALTIQPSNQLPPPQPDQYPSLDQTVMISGRFLTDKLVQNAYNYVNSIVPASLLSLKVSTYQPNNPASPIYNDDTSKTCYWPNDLCVQRAATSSFGADVFNCPTQNDWGLTYDDGPSYDPNNQYGTPQLVDALSKSNLHATFFIIGSNAIQYPSILKQTFKANHEICAHTWSHHPLTALTNQQIVAEIKYTEAMIYNITGVVTKCFRPPYGDVDNRVRAIVSALGYRTILWTSDPDRDTNDASVEPTTANQIAIITNVKSNFFQAQAGFVSLQHDRSPFLVNLDLSILGAISSAKAANTFQTNPKPVGQCLGIPASEWYQSIDAPSSIPTIPVAIPTPTTSSASSIPTSVTSLAPTAIPPITVPLTPASTSNPDSASTPIPTDILFSSSVVHTSTAAASATILGDITSLAIAAQTTFKGAAHKCTRRGR